MTRQTGDLYIFEGPDAVGKSTIADAFAEVLRAKGRRVVTTSSPGTTKGTLGELVYRLHHQPNELGVSSICPTSRQVLHVAAHIDALKQEIRPCLSDGIDVVLDRCWISTLVYGRLGGVGSASLQKMVALELESWTDLRPRCTFVVTAKKQLRPDPDRETWQKLTAAYSKVVDELDASWHAEILPNDTKIQSAIDAALRRVPETAGPSNTIAQHRSSRNSLRPAIPTKVYDTYWHFATERQNVFFARLRDDGRPHTSDSILSRYRFTNAYRVADRVSQYLIQHVIEGATDDPDDLFFRILLFKTFNKIDTWEWLVRELGEPHWENFEFSLYDRVLTWLGENGQSIYSAAYIMPSGGKAFGYHRKHQNHLALIGAMIKDDLPKRIADAKSMKQVFELLCSYPMIGPFLGYQYATDINYSSLTDFSEMEFVIPGPGAKDGIRKCFSNLGGLSEAEIIRLVTERQEDEFAARGLNFRRLGNRPLQLIDCQNLFCEVDKYARVAHPDVQGVSGRTRIKQQYRPNPQQLKIVLPAKWNVSLQEKLEEHGDAGVLFR